MSFAAFSEEPLRSLVDHAGGAEELTLLVGAGASMEAGMPSWDELLRRLLLRGGEGAGMIPPESTGDGEAEEDRRHWLEQAGRDGPLGKAALAEALSGEDRDDWIREALFGEGGDAGDYYPGPTSREIARLRDVFGADLKLITLNYDDLIEQALLQGGHQPHTVATGKEDFRVPRDQVGVYHLHGYLGRDGPPRGKLILSEADYMRMQDGRSWQETVVSGALMESTVVFVGTSMVDLNVLRYLHGVPPADPDRRDRFALFVRQGTYERSVPQRLREAREQALAKRWEALGVKAIFLDHYTDVAQVLHEIGRRRGLGDSYVPLPERADKWATRVRADVLGCDGDGAFLASQRTVNGLLVEALSKARERVEKQLGKPWKETLQLALWLTDGSGSSLTTWVMSDRLHVERETIEPVPVSEYSKWLAVRSYCQGTPLAESRDVYASRWKFVRGTPLVADGESIGRLPVGCLTTASMSPAGETLLSMMPGELLREFNKTLGDTVLALLAQPFADDS